MKKKTNMMLRSLLRQLTAAFLILVLAAAPIAALPVHAAAQSPEEVLNNEVTDAVLSVAINCSGTEVGLLEITEDAFRFARLPHMNDFNRVRFQVIDSAGNDVVVEYRDIESGQTVSFPMQMQFPDGDYGLYLGYKIGVTEDGYNQYRHWAKVVVAKTLDGWQLKSADAYRQNMEFAAQERTDPDAQAWFLRPSKDVQSDDPQIVALATQLTEGIDNAYDKALAIHDWVCNNVSYDLDYINGARERGDFSASVVYTEKQTVCLGFANFTAALLRAAGIPAKVVKGYAKGLSVKEEYPDEVFEERKTNHAWNEFYADGGWHAMDTTWDCGNTMEYGEVTGNLGCEGRNYFDPGPEWFAETHALVKCADLVEHTYYVDYSYMYERRSGAWYAYSDDGAVPYLEDGRTMIPLASAVRFLDGSLVWDEEANPGWITLSCQILGRRVFLFVGYPVFYVDGVAYSFSQAPVLKDGHVRVEARAFFSAIGCDVRWDGRTEWGKGAVTVSYEELL